MYRLSCIDGINMDFENMYKEDKDMYSRLIIELQPRISEIGVVTTVDVTARITYQNGYYFDRIQSALEQTIEDYFNELNESWGNEKNLVVRISRIESRILDLEGVLDVSDTELNGLQRNIEIDADNIVVRGQVNDKRN